MDALRIITISFVPLRSGGPYWRISVYEFKGEKGKAQFVQDLGVGFYDKTKAEESARQFSKSLDLIYVPGISLFDSVVKVYDHIFK